MSSAAVPVENYHLKWDSHLNYLNLAVATLYKNEKFADVILLPSHPAGGSGIPAHKIILSSCSQFFASILDGNPVGPNSVMYIVLPPDLSRRAIQILVQYMYSGESTVSNDILNEVLRGGELLKIRGLCRSTTGCSSGGYTNQPPHHSAHYSLHHTKENEESLLPIRIEGIQPRTDHRHSCTNGHTVLQESPVVVVTPPQPHPPLLSPQAHSTSHNSLVAQNISIKKDVAIDPDDNRSSSSSHYGLLSLQIAAAVKKAQQTGENSSFKGYYHDRQRRESIDRDCSTRRFSEEALDVRENPHLEGPSSSNDVHHSRRFLKEDDNCTKIDRRRPSLPDVESIKHLSRKSFSSLDHGPVSELPEPLNFLSIKEEPRDWQADSENSGGISAKYSALLPPLDIVKSESPYSGEHFPTSEEKDDDDEDSSSFSPLTCELCSKTFTLPSDWVRHIETHTSNPRHCLPKKRKRQTQGRSPELIASLKCDLCAMYFETPGEWVRHIQRTHTETELAISNNRPPPKKKIRETTSHEYAMLLDRTCCICSKKFPSYGSMIIHKRTHASGSCFDT